MHDTLEQTLDYQRIHKGNHPDLPQFEPKDHTDVEAAKRQSLAVDLGLRDVLSPLMIDFSNGVKNDVNVGKNQIKERQGRSRFRFPYLSYVERVIFATELRFPGMTGEQLIDRYYELHRVKINHFMRQGRAMSADEHQEYSDLFRYGKLYDSTDSIPDTSHERPVFDDSATGSLFADYLYHGIRNGGILNKCADFHLKPFGEYIWQPTDIKPASPFVNSYGIPVGQYGDEFAQRTAKTVLTLLEMSGPLAADQSARIFLENPDLIGKHTARGQDENGGLSHNHGNPVLLALQEGIISLGSTVALLTAERVAGFDNPGDLLRALVQRGVFNDMSVIMPMGVIGPAVLHGKYIPGIVEVDDKGLGLSRQFLFAARQVHMEQAHNAYKRKAKGQDSNETVTGFGCPVGKTGHAIPTSGNQELSEAFLRIYQSL